RPGPQPGEVEWRPRFLPVQPGWPERRRRPATVRLPDAASPRSSETSPAQYRVERVRGQERTKRVGRGASRGQRGREHYQINSVVTAAKNLSSATKSACD